ncbi:MAG TPA: PilZ domain-containing protein [Alphaproteobacteria bacterium]|nr:PilZ domain-containing protein [Alphaproteobacteria bacterium]
MQSPQNRQRRDATADRRAFPRYTVDLPASLSINGQSAPCKLVDVSAGGALLRTDRKVAVGDMVSVDLPHCGPTIGTVVRLTPSHVAVSFRGLLVVSQLCEPGIGMPDNG